MTDQTPGTGNGRNAREKGNENANENGRRNENANVNEPGKGNDANAKGIKIFFHLTFISKRVPKF